MIPLFRTEHAAPHKTDYRLHSPLRIASRALSEKARTLEIRSCCVASNVLPQATARFFSTISRLCCVSAFASVISCEVTSGAMVGSVGFSAGVWSGAGAGTTRGLAGTPRLVTKRGASGAESTGITGGGSNSALAAAGITGCAKAMTPISGLAGALLMKHPLVQVTDAHNSNTKFLFTFDWAFISLQIRQSPFSCSQRQLDAEGRSAANFRREINRTVV